MKKHIIGGVEFNESIYNSIINNYSEAFTHTSLSIEKEFIKLESYTEKIRKILNDNDELYKQISDIEKAKALINYHYFVTYMAYYYKMIPQIDFNNEEIIDAVYEENFKDFDIFFTRLLSFDKDGKIQTKETGRNVSMFFPLYIERKPILEKAHSSRKNHIEGFNYALNQTHIGINEILEINKIINESNPNKQIGFKKVNNTITGATIETMKKEEIPTQISELIYKYDHNFDMEIKDHNEEGITEEERYKRLFLICLKEARFHIQFERIHPFSDGNGRTGRIIMSANMIKQHLAPPLITSIMLEQYKNFISNSDYQGLAQMILDSSSQTLSTWVTIKREKEGMAIDEIMNEKTI